MKRLTATSEASIAYTAVIGDMLASRTLPKVQRDKVQRRFAAFVTALNEDPRYQSALASKFVITLGDEFQGVLTDATVVPDLIWDLAHAAELPKFRLGIGFGTIDTAIPPYAINLDGPALHAARKAVDQAKKDKLIGGVFVGFGEQTGTVLNGISQLLQFHWERRTAHQREVLGMLRAGATEVAIAKVKKRTQQTVHDHKRAAGVEAFLAGEQALKAMLKLATEARST